MTATPTASSDPGSADTPGRVPVLSTVGVFKSYDEVQALRGVDFSLYPGEVVGLVGANGAGKSTLIRILTGLVAPDAGEVMAEGTPMRPTIQAARAAGVTAVHQELNLVPAATVAENVLLWNLPRRAGMVSRREMRRRAGEVVAQLGVELPLDMPAAELTAVQQRLVMVAAALSQNAKVLILDEPTASLPADEAQHVLKVARELRRLGKSVVFVSHRLDEVVAVVDRAVVMRDGRVVRELAPGEVDIETMMELIGAKRVAALDRRLRHPISNRTEVILSARGVYGSRVRELELDVRGGEILGVAGLVGAGRSELLRLLAGVQRHRAGELLLRGKSWSRDAARGEVGYVGERRGDHLFADFDVSSNVSLPSLGRFKHWRCLLDAKQEHNSVADVLGRTGVKGGPRDTMGSLSGGNKQKVLLARWLLVESKVLILDEPTAGVDVGARAELHALLREIADAGGAVVVAISDPKELLALCNRVIVLREGRLTLDTVAPFHEGEILAASYADLSVTA
ncbi:MAG: sugar ABC transporter ATP-binding protein [Solirubrobacteraceae bacterium]